MDEPTFEEFGNALFEELEDNFEILDVFQDYRDVPDNQTEERRDAQRERVTEESDFGLHNAITHTVDDKINPIDEDEYILFVAVQGAELLGQSTGTTGQEAEIDHNIPENASAFIDGTKQIVDETVDNIIPTLSVQAKDFLGEKFLNDHNFQQPENLQGADDEEVVNATGAAVELSEIGVNDGAGNLMTLSNTAPVAGPSGTSQIKNFNVSDAQEPYMEKVLDEFGLSEEFLKQIEEFLAKPYTDITDFVTDLGFQIFYYLFSSEELSTSNFSGRNKPNKFGKAKLIAAIRFVLYLLPVVRGEMELKDVSFTGRCPELKDIYLYDFLVVHMENKVFCERHFHAPKNLSLVKNTTIKNGFDLGLEIVIDNLRINREVWINAFYERDEQEIGVILFEHAFKGKLDAFDKIPDEQILRFLKIVKWMGDKLHDPYVLNIENVDSIIILEEEKTEMLKKITAEWKRRELAKKKREIAKEKMRQQIEDQNKEETTIKKRKC